MPTLIYEFTWSAIFRQHSSLALLAVTVLHLAVMIFFVFLITHHYAYLLLLAEACRVKVINFCQKKCEMMLKCPLYGNVHTV